VRRLLARSVPIAVLTVAGCLGAAAVGSSGTTWRSGRAPAVGSGTSSTVGAATEDSATLYVDPQSFVARWVTDHPDHGLAPPLLRRLTDQPQARWVTDPDPARAGADVAAYVRAAAAARAVPVLVLYALPGRDCGGASAGGAGSWPAYARWIEAVARAIGTAEAIVVLEPDSLALQTCMSSDDSQQRHGALSSAVDVLTSSSPAVRVFLDGGHSAWNPVPVQASRLREAGVDRADGFATNVSNYQRTSAEIVYGRRLQAVLGGRPQQVIDTGRNGAGPLGTQWCDPEGRLLGRSPTLDTGVDGVATYLWVKPPGEADGCAAKAGTFLPETAAALAGGTSPTAHAGRISRPL
jgi:endoglucanase